MVFALGTFISVTDRSDQANNIDLGVGMMLASVGNDGSPLVRKVGILLSRVLLTKSFCLTHTHSNTRAVKLQKDVSSLVQQLESSFYNEVVTFQEVVVALFSLLQQF